MAQKRVPGLVPAPLSEQDGGFVARAEYILAHQKSAVAAEAAVGMLTTVGDLLSSFIGESLTTRLLCEAWPDDFAGDTTKETTT